MADVEPKVGVNYITSMAQPGGKVGKEDAQEAKRWRREKFDDELDTFLREESTDDGSHSASHPSKMRADYIETKGKSKSLLEHLMCGYFTDDMDVDSWKNVCSEACQHSAQVVNL